MAVSGMGREWLVFAAATSSFFFASATTFQSLGVVLFAMQRDFPWSQTAAGGAFLALGLSCCGFGLLPVLLVRRIGARWTMVCGGLIFGAGFVCAALTRDLWMIYLASVLLGLGFLLAASVPGTHLIASWFGPTAPRMIGLYLMCGTLGGAVGPPMAEALIASGGWRLYWRAMAVGALAIAGGCAVGIRERSARLTADERQENAIEVVAATEEWRSGQALRSSQFVILALALIATQTGLVTVSSVAAAHFFRLGWADGVAARLLGAQAFVATVATGVAGWLAERCDPRRLNAGALLSQAAGTLLLAFARTGWLADIFVLVFGLGWSVCRVAVTVLLIRYFGHRAGTVALSAVWMLCGIAAAGPPAAGLVADLTGSFVPALSLLGLVLLPLAAAAALMRPPRRRLPDLIIPQHP